MMASGIEQLHHSICGDYITGFVHGFVAMGSQSRVNNTDLKTTRSENHLMKTKGVPDGPW
jgi:hypothetical protein